MAGSSPKVNWIAGPAIAIVGAGRCGRAESDLAMRVGRLLGERSAVLVCGGLGGVMEASCRGAKEAGGLTVGVLPGSDRRSGNRYLDVVVPTGMGEARNIIVVRCAEAIIAVGGEFGTLSEISFALKLGIPVIGLQTWRLTQCGEQSPAVRKARTPEQAVRLAFEAAGRPMRQKTARRRGRQPGRVVAMGTWR